MRPGRVIRLQGQQVLVVGLGTYAIPALIPVQEPMLSAFHGELKFL
jgi:hypothetical protein